MLRWITADVGRPAGARRRRAWLSALLWLAVIGVVVGLFVA